MERRLKAFEVSPELFISLFTTGVKDSIYEVIDGLPNDAKLVYVEYFTPSGRITFTVHSDEFDPVPEGVMPSLIRITMKSYPNLQAKVRLLVKEELLSIKSPRWEE